MKKALTVGLHIRHKARLHGRLTDVEFHSASRQPEALEILQGEEGIDLIVVDENLDDSELFLQKIKPLEIPTIYCANGEKSTGFLRSLVVELDVAVVLVKPVDPDEMVRKAGELLSAKRTVSERSDGVQEQMRARLAALWEKFGPSNRERLSWLKSQFNDILDGEDKDETARREIEREAHKMVGALGTFGFPQATILAREIELHVAPKTSMAHLDGTQLMNWAQALEKELNNGPQGTAAQAKPIDGPSLLVLSENSELLTQLQNLEYQGKALHLEQVSSWIRARESWFLRAPDLVIVDLCDEAAPERQTLLNSVAAKLSTIPVLIILPKEVLSSADSLSRYAGFPILSHPYEPKLLDSTVIDLLSSDERPKPKVLAVDDDPQILDALCVLLEPMKLEITTLSDPLEFWDTLERCDPNLLILDLDMPFLSGLELCRGVRSSPRWWELPVVFLSGSSDAENLNRLYSVGADDFVPKPFAGPELATRVVNRLVRSAGRQSSKKKADYENGLDGLRRILSQERYQRSQVLIALLRVQNKTKLEEKAGVAQISQLNRELGIRLADSLRGIGAVARWRNHEFVIALPEQTLDGGSHLLESCLSQKEIVDFSNEHGESLHLEVVAGTTSMKNSTESLEAALRQCQYALQTSDSSSSSLIYSSPMSDNTPTEQISKSQILVLEADTNTGQAVEKLLQDQGYKVDWRADTEKAIGQLTSIPPSIETQVIFISSGSLQLLSKLGSVTQLVNVVVAVSTEQELITAFNNGAYDCLEKPCKVGTILKRLERALSN